MIVQLQKKRMTCPSKGYHLKGFADNMSTPEKRNNTKEIVFVFLLTAPAVIHTVAFASVAMNGLEIGRIDAAFVVLLVGYLCACVVVCRGTPGTVGRFLLLTYASLCTAGLAETALWFVFPPPPGNVPISPRVRKSVAADTMPGISGPIVYSVNEIGLRGPQTTLADATWRILCVGGSTTECLYVTDEKSWPWLLQDRLAASLGENVFVGNAGKSGQFTRHHSYQIRNYPLANEFDWVVVLCGINDAGAFLWNAYAERSLAVPQQALTGSFDGVPYYRRLSAVRFIQRWHQTQFSEQVVVQDPAGLWYSEERKVRQAKLARNTITEIPEGCEEALDRYRVDLVDIIAACRERGVKLVLMTQPTLYKHNLSPELDRLLCAHSQDRAYTPGILSELMEKYNQTMREVCEGKNVDMIDLASVIPKDTTAFYDDCHFNISGCEKVASAVFSFFDSRLEQTAK
jgi:lysophospholipase L1-like esterase